MADYIWPVPGYYYISQYFSPGGHRGIDVPAPEGTPIVSCAGGTVIRARYDESETASYGYFVKIDHGNGMITVYAHCSQLLVTEGQTVTQNQNIALVGSTGYSTGNHLHLEFQLNGTLVDPLDYITDSPEPPKPPTGQVPFAGIISELKRRKVML